MSRLERLKVHRSSIDVNHDIQIAHRLMNLPGKCQNIHGHSMNVTLVIYGYIDDGGILAGLDFSSIKKTFREYLDTTFDHQLHLNTNDPWARELINDRQYAEMTNNQIEDGLFAWSRLPGVRTWPGDPTTEFMSKWICEHMFDLYEAKHPMEIYISETATNGARYSTP